MKILDKIDVSEVSAGENQSGSPALAGIGLSVSCLPMPIDPVYVPELL